MYIVYIYIYRYIAICLGIMLITDHLKSLKPLYTIQNDLECTPQKTSLATWQLRWACTARRASESEISHQNPWVMEISRVYNWNIVIFIEWENPLYIYGFTLWQLTAAMVYRYINRLQKITMGNFPRPTSINYQRVVLEIGWFGVPSPSVPLW